MRHSQDTAMYEIIEEADGNRYRFYCDLSGTNVCTTEPIRAAADLEELRIAWETQGRQHFNRCHKCGKWVIDAMYNADVCACVQCTPWEYQPPRFCKHCGARVKPGEAVCGVCQKALIY